MRPHDAPSARSAKGVVRVAAAALAVGAALIAGAGSRFGAARAESPPDRPGGDKRAASSSAATPAGSAMPSNGAIAERRSDVRIETTKSYWTELPSAMGALPEHIPHARRGLLVITGTLRNASRSPVHHVLLAYDLVDAAGKVVFHEEGYNRAAESLIELDASVVIEGEDAPGTAPLPFATAPPAAAPPIEEIPPGGTDTFRMIIPGEEVPAFDHPTVSVVSAH